LVERGFSLVEAAERKEIVDPAGSSRTRQALEIAHARYVLENARDVPRHVPQELLGKSELKRPTWNSDRAAGRSRRKSFARASGRDAVAPGEIVTCRVDLPCSTIRAAHGGCKPCSSASARRSGNPDASSSSPITSCRRRRGEPHDPARDAATGCARSREELLRRDRHLPRRAAGKRAKNLRRECSWSAATAIRHRRRVRRLRCSASARPRLLGVVVTGEIWLRVPEDDLLHWRGRRRTA